MPSFSSRWAIGFLLLAAGGCDRQAPPAPQATPSAPTAKPGSVDRSHAGEAMPDVAFERPDGSPAQLPDFKGTPLLLNLWATWCAPCVAELPTLDRAAATPGIAVLAVSQDTQPDKVAPFLAERGLKRLAPYRDPKLGLSLAFAANLPTTIFFGADGRERWRFTGGMDWTGAQAKALLAQR
ncbi:TlpA family protein disulfide reductase [Sphingomonas sp.]|jgi:thiol-disulfide isomerase/thioredoxin|uniref:TlpA family protein disulfide reductase n=1 Tax=Sphingomonas sp. TaxID=28214 RepID=UPI0035C7A0D8